MVQAFLSIFPSGGTWKQTMHIFLKDPNQSLKPDEYLWFDDIFFKDLFDAACVAYPSELTFFDNVTSVGYGCRSRPDFIIFTKDTLTGFGQMMLTPNRWNQSYPLIGKPLILPEVRSVIRYI